MTGDGTVRMLADRAAIQDVLTRLALAQDRREWDALEACFLPDARYTHPGGELRGAAEIVERSRRALSPLDASQHLLGTMLVEVGDDGVKAWATTYFQAQHVRRGVVGGDLYVIAGTYMDQLHRVDGHWRIAHRAQEYSWRDGNPDVIVRASGPEGAG